MKNKKYVIVQRRIEHDRNGVPKITEALLAYPDSQKNASFRILKWRSALGIENLHMREAQREDYPKSRRRKK